MLFAVSISDTEFYLSIIVHYKWKR